MSSTTLISRSDAPRVLMVGGGTGGHAYPAIAIADAIRDIAPRAVVEFAGSRSNIEWRIVPESGYAIHHVSVRGLQRRWTRKNLTKVDTHGATLPRLYAGRQPPNH